MQPGFAIRNFMNETFIFLVLKKVCYSTWQKEGQEEVRGKKNKEKKERGREREGRS